MKLIFVDDGKGDLFMGEYEIDMEMLVKHRTVAVGILGYGAVTSFIFIFVAMMRSLGKTHFLLIINILIIDFNSGVSYYNSTNEIRTDEKSK